MVFLRARIVATTQPENKITLALRTLAPPKQAALQRVFQIKQCQSHGEIAEEFGGGDGALKV
jgi:hypothetical protein